MPKIIPVPDELSKPFWDAVNERRLSLQSCTACSLAARLRDASETRGSLTRYQSLPTVTYVGTSVAHHLCCLVTPLARAFTALWERSLAFRLLRAAG